MNHFNHGENHPETKKAIDTRYSTKQAIIDVQNIWLRHFSGDLTTIMRANHPLSEYPINSVVPYVFDKNFSPVVYISEIAEHTNNAFANSKASLFLRENRQYQDVQQQWRLCAVGDLRLVPEEEVQEVSDAYFRYYPHSGAYKNTHDFHFFRLEVKKYRIIMGFGDIRWVAADAVFSEKSFSAEVTARIINHMNEDHADSLVKYLNLQNIEVKAGNKVEMVDIHDFGINIRNGEGIYFVPFAEPVRSAEEAKSALIQLARS